jgi:ComEC/Rec2-related protein
MFSRLTSLYYVYNFINFLRKFLSKLNSESFLICLTVNLLTLKLSYQYETKVYFLTITIVITFIICLIFFTLNQILRAKLFCILMINIVILFLNFLSIHITSRNKIVDFKKDLKVTLMSVKETGLTASSNQDVFIIKKLVPTVEEWINRDSIIIDEYYKGNIPICSEIDFWAIIESSQNSNFLRITNVRSPENIGSYSKLILNQLEKKVGEINSMPVAFGWAMLTGSKAFISDSFLDKLRSTGTLHLFAVSGLHIGFLYMFITVLCFPLKNKFYISLPLKILFCLLYLILIGMPQTGLRALLMIIFFEITCFLRIKNKSIIFFCLTCITFIIFSKDPFFNLSNQLSFTIILFILFILNNNSLLKFLKIIVLKYFVLLFFVSLAASSGSFFIILDYFGKFAYLGLPVNIFISPLVFIFYIFNIIFFLLFIMFDSTFIFFMIDYIFKIIFFIINISYDLTSFLPKQELNTINLGGSFHLIVFLFILFSFCFRINFRFKICFLLSYYFLAWFGVFLYSLST